MGLNKKRENVFRFKQFDIKNERSAMKVGTDGVLLGAWCDIATAKKVLDIGAGTGLIAIMVAQRNSDARIIGIEIDSDAASEAMQNVDASPWRERIGIINDDFIKIAQANRLGKFDHIVSNPPYFSSSVTAPDVKRTLARHCSTLNYASLIELSSQLLNPNGKLSVISPADCYDDIIFLASLYHLSVSRITKVLSTPQSQPIRILWEFTPKTSALQNGQIVIQKAPNIYTPEYIALTRDFYLKM